MRPLVKLELVDKIAQHLQARFVFSDLFDYLSEWQLPEHLPPVKGYVSKRVYSKDVIKYLPDAIILKIAEELGVELPRAGATRLLPPRNWRDANCFRLFISHVSSEKEKATRLRECLAPYAISGFVAHEDIQPTHEWQSEIERALNFMDAFLTVHTAGFSRSVWTQQEIGFAVGRGVKIISLKMGDEDPTGFIFKQQALPRRGRTAEEIADEIATILRDDPQTGPRLNEVRAANASKPEFEEIPF